MKELRLLDIHLGPLDFHSRTDTSVDPAIRSLPRQGLHNSAGTLVSRWRPCPASLRRRCRALPSSQETLLCLRPGLRPRSGLHALPITALRCCPPSHETEDPRRFCHFSGLILTASTLAVYASCRPHGRRRKTRLRVARIAIYDNALGLPFPRGIRTHRVPIECFSFGMFYVIPLPPHSLSFDGATRAVTPG